MITIFDFVQLPNSHLSNIGCPICNESKGEKIIRRLLNEQCILYKKEKTFKGCEYKGRLKFDFYLPKHNICIEYDGIQHYKPIEYFGGEKSLILNKLKDKIKTEYCYLNNIQLIRIRYDEDINKKLSILI